MLIAKVREILEVKHLGNYILLKSTNGLTCEIT